MCLPIVVATLIASVGEDPTLRPNITRTVVLAFLLAVAGIWWLAREFDIETERLISFFVQSIAFVGFAILIAAITAFIIRKFRR